ncbi:hypothetical protein, partial [Acinetobacter variabilis]|uniref:hypothetical protein n=1 Tax=Acinetobacter variabilis TaxID=70346 RepID=UPI0030F60D41
KVFVCTHILTVRTQVFLFKANYGTAVTFGLLFFVPDRDGFGVITRLAYIWKFGRFRINKS